MTDTEKHTGILDEQRFEPLCRRIDIEVFEMVDVGLSQVRFASECLDVFEESKTCIKAFRKQSDKGTVMVDDELYAFIFFEYAGKG